MADLKPIGSEKLQGQEKINRMKHQELSLKKYWLMEISMKS
jgi:hypothetical protein